MHLIELSDATTFLEHSRPLLMESEAENNLLLSSALTLAKASATRSSRLSFFVVEKNGRAVCAALNAAERRLLLSSSTGESAAFMGNEMARRESKVRGVLGPSLAAAAFCEGYVAHRSAEAPEDATELVKFSQRLHQNVMRLDTPLECRLSSGIMRAAKPKDLKLLLHWSLKFVNECKLDERPEETEEIVRRYLENRQLFLWEDNQPVAMAGFGGLTPNGVRVNMVYTDERHRSKGYAGTLVHLLSRKLLNEGHRNCYLFSDALDPIANHVYEKLGYRTVGDFAEFRR